MLAVPLTVEELASRAYRYAIDPLRNPLKEAMDDYDTVRAAPPLLGIFSDIPAHKLREDEVLSWARAGFSFVVLDGEHSLHEGRHGREHYRMLLRHGITAIQRLHREAVSEHGDCLTMGARATMRPYGITPDETATYLEAIAYPCLLYTSDAADEEDSVDLGGRRIIKKKKK
eukprot:TRINITY_DN2790_c0_g1_i2.p1 TRINITY_DN2790_c0_g1~~TRINITY_DN2790_c0_g1_i2.p1  ORF type:complete len:172 (-),score=43.67 TRINITY_DN2790_c0_g1_i2:62-577(-)